MSITINIEITIQNNMPNIKSVSRQPKQLK